MWQGDIPDVGCSIAAGCSPNDAIVASPFIDSNDEIVVNWVAQDKDRQLPYVCQSKCPRYYVWIKGNDNPTTYLGLYASTRILPFNGWSYSDFFFLGNLWIINRYEPNPQ